MTSVLERGPWYYVLRTYKRGLPDEHMPILVALARSYLDEHQVNIAGLLGGEPTLVSIVPSKRGETFETQPLRDVVEYTLGLRGDEDQLGHTLRFVGDRETDYRQEYFPGEFDQGPREADGERVLVLEDGWASGATAVSTAGALLANGAESVAILSLARIINPGYWSEGHPYRQFMDREYDLTDWPR